MTISSILGLKKEILEDLAIAGGLIGVQFVYAGNSVLLSYLMSIGLNSLTIVIFSTFSTFLIISPFAFYFERVTLFQTFFLKGIKLTSPALATAMPNLAPGFIFIIAWTLRLERVRIGCIYSKVKIMGTLLCVVGALTMSLMHSRSSKEASSFISFPTDISIDMEKLVGCAYLVAAVLVLSSNVVLQVIKIVFLSFLLGAIRFSHLENVTSCVFLVN
ncbi:WAT1-related protein At5g47470 [Linum perenne]